MDFIRGIAVLGLVYMNSYAFGVFELGYIAHSNAPVSDSIIYIFSTLFVDGRFRTLFSLLFGAGLYIQWQRYKSDVQLKSRLYWLILFGLAHGFLLWAGDILFVYGISGWFTLKYLQSDNALLLRRGLAFILLCGITTGLVMYSAPVDIIYRDSQDFISLYSPHYFDYFISNLGMNALMVFIVPIMTLWMCAGIMLIGIYLYKQGVFSEGLSTKQLVITVIATATLSAFRLYTSQYSSGFMYAIQESINMFAALGMATLYIHLIVKFCNNRAHVGKLIQQTGRLAFTLYISQTLMQLLLYKVLFTHWVLGFDRIDYWVLATALVVLQLIFTFIYSRYFNQGPLEFVWRKLTKAKINA
ncbi:DUF418 domain-containing protein [Pseudoalteromonas sp. SCSIO 43210]